jgi:phosphoribosylaminoimidazolecarboxamide formyltransferase/IMP cyclohydrolase
MKPIFLEIIMAPSFSEEALEVLSTKKNLRLLQVDMTKDESVVNQYVSVNGGLLVQDLDKKTAEVTAETVVIPDIAKLETGIWRTNILTAPPDLLKVSGT